MYRATSRRMFLKSTSAAAAALALPTVSLARAARAAEPKIVKKTFVYKKVGNLPIQADVYRADDSQSRPVVVWIHGGALINGHREAVSGRVKQDALAEGYALVSIDYRLAPETQLPGIISDLEDAFTWIHDDGPRLFAADNRKVAVTGGSAGGYLTLTAGYRAKPRPKVLAAFWGYGDLVGDWYSKPSPHPRHHKIKMSKEEAYAQVAGPPIADSRQRKGDGGAFYQWCRQHGAWPRAVSGWDPHEQAEKFYPYMPVKNVTADYPPTILIHGTDDTDVPYQQSVMMAEQFKQHGVQHELVTVPGAEHGLAGGDARLIDLSYRSAFAFIQKHLQ